jgi:hypothetical protein
MELKATNDDGKSNRVSGFQLTADNVLSTGVGDKVTVKDNVDFTKAVTTDARNNQKAIGITSNGVIDLAAYAQGVYTLDVVVDDDRAYEAIIAIGDQTNHIVDKEITRVNSEYTTEIEFVFPTIENPKPPKDIGLPYCDLIEPSAPGPNGCFDRKDGDDINGYPCRDGSKVSDWRDCKDAGKHPDEQLKEMKCPAHAGGCEDINEDDVIIFPDNSVEFPTEEIDCELQPELCEEIPNVPLEETEEEELPEEEELTETTEIEEIEEEEEEVEEESGGSEEVENEESEEESVGESEEE